MGTTQTKKREFTQTDVEYAIQKSAEHCAWLLKYRGQSQLTTADAIKASLAQGRMPTLYEKNKSFSERGSVTSLSLRLQSLQQAINGYPTRTWLHYWTKR